MDRIKKAGRFLLGLINDILAFAKLEVVSEVGRGSVFTISLPAT